MKQNKIINDFMPVAKEELSERGIEELDTELKPGTDANIYLGSDCYA